MINQPYLTSCCKSRESVLGQGGDLKEEERRGKVAMVWIQVRLHRRQRLPHFRLHHGPITASAC